MRRLFPLLPVTLALAGCTGTTPIPAGPPAVTAPAPAETEPDLFGSDDILAPETLAEGIFQQTGTAAVTYDPVLVPIGATALLSTFAAAGGLAVRLAVSGMVPGHMYGARLDSGPCAPATAPAPSASASPSSAPSPAPSAVPSADPSASAPDDGGVRLDFTADRTGRATVTIVRAAPFDAGGPPRSLVVDARPAPVGAGARVACLTVARG